MRKQVFRIAALWFAAYATNTFAVTWWPYAGHEYTQITTQTHWDDAQQYAEGVLSTDLSGQYPGQPAYLACITSAAEDAFLSATFSIGGWVGGYQPPGSGEPAADWRWVSGEPWSYTNWQPGEPNDNGTEDWLLWAPSGWNDQLYVTSNFIVERVPEPTTLFLLVVGGAFVRRRF